MKDDIAFEKCRSYIDCQWQDRSGLMRGGRGLKPGPAITLSRQTGSGARSVAAKLAEHLERICPRHQCPWTVFDRTLVEKVLEEHNLPRDFARFMPEDRRSYLDDVMEELVGLHPPSWTLLRQTTETILHLAEMGHVILIGRAANVITAKLPYVFHVRLIGSPEVRLQRVMGYYDMPRKEAAQFMRKEDRGRSRYVEKYFQCSVDDGLLYNLVINTDRISDGQAAQLIGLAAVQHFQVQAE